MVQGNPPVETLSRFRCGECIYDAMFNACRRLFGSQYMYVLQMWFNVPVALLELSLSEAYFQWRERSANFDLIWQQSFSTARHPYGRYGNWPLLTLPRLPSLICATVVVTVASYLPYDGAKTL